MEKSCLVEGCDGKLGGLGYCSKHYQRYKKYGDAQYTQRKDFRYMSLEDRLAHFIVLTPTCWLWTGKLNNKGYATVRDSKGKTRKAHRLVYRLFKGEIPEGMQVDHKYRVYGCPRNCVNPEHLRPVTNKQNQENRPAEAKGTESGVRGITWSTQNRKWIVRMGHDGVRLYLGSFTDLGEAVDALEAGRAKYYTHYKQE